MQPSALIDIVHSSPTVWTPRRGTVIHIDINNIAFINPYLPVPRRAGEGGNRLGEEGGSVSRRDRVCKHAVGNMPETDVDGIGQFRIRKGIRLGGSVYRVRLLAHHGDQLKAPSRRIGAKKPSPFAHPVTPFVQFLLLP